MEQMRILWVDDEIELLKPHILFLEHKGYEMKTANNGEDALEIGLVDELGDLESAIADAASRAGLDSLDEDQIVFLPEAMDPLQAFVEDLAGAEMLGEALVKAGIPEEQWRQWLSVKRMVESKDRIQARLPYGIDIK